MAAGDPGPNEPLRLDQLHLDRRQLLRSLGLGGAALAVPGLLAACGSSGGSGGSSGSPGGSTSSAPGNTSDADIPSLQWALNTSTIVGLDIATAFESNSQCVAVCGMEGLLGVSDKLTLVPLLATSWKYDEPNLKYVLQIRQGVKFWDGTPMTMDDVVFSLGRHIDPKVSSQIAGYFANVASFKQTGASEVTVKLKHADPTIANSLVFAPILSKAFAEKIGKALGSPGSGLRIMGTGPYKISSYPSSTAATVERFDGYWGAKPRVQSCTFSCISDTQTLQLAIQSGQAAGTLTVPVQDAANYQKMSGVQTYSTSGMEICALTFDTSTPPFDDLHVRKAIAYACDREGYVRAFLGGNGTPADCVVPPQQWGSVLPQSQVASMYAKLPSYPFSIENAKKELAQSAHPNGFTTNKILVPNNQPAVLKALESLSTTVKQIGITMPISQVPSNDWLANIYAHKDLGIVCLLFLPDYADPADYMNLIYPSANAVKNNFNLANYKNPKVDKLIQDANAASSNAERAQDLSQVLTISQQDLPYFGLFWQNDVMAIQNKYVYKGFTGLYYNQNWLSRIYVAS
ncbi:MAG TPA: ABC transporter substrate-binding protein [Streptosporangiaceae bacterium]